MNAPEPFDETRLRAEIKRAAPPEDVPADVQERLEATYSALASEPQERARRLPLRHSTAIALAACLAGALGVVGVANLLWPSDQDATTGDDRLAIENVFAPPVLKAYASTNDALPLLSDNTLVFASTGTMSYVPEASLHEQQGAYIDCLFGLDIERTDVTQVELRTSFGEVYQYSERTFLKSENPDLWNNVLNSKPGNKANNPELAAFDYVHPLAVNDDVDRAADDKTVGYGGYTRLGSSAKLTAPFADGRTADQLRFGLWTNAPVPESDNTFASLYGLFDGAHLTITATFGDGTSSTQVIELSVANIKARTTKEADGSQYVIEPLEIIDARGADDMSVSEEEASQGIDIRTTLVGRVINDE